MKILFLFFVRSDAGAHVWFCLQNAAWGASGAQGGVAPRGPRPWAGDPPPQRDRLSAVGRGRHQGARSLSDAAFLAFRPPRRVPRTGSWRDARATLDSAWKARPASRISSTPCQRWPAKTDGTRFSARKTAEMRHIRPYPETESPLGCIPTGAGPRLTGAVPPPRTANTLRGASPLPVSGGSGQGTGAGPPFALAQTTG